jgi:hypothetical protein
MVHFSCDRCKRMIDPRSEPRYVVRIGALAIEPDADGAPHDDRDALARMDELLDAAEGAAVGCDDCDTLASCRHFDLCSQCMEAYRRDPLGTEASIQVGFSEN